MPSVITVECWHHKKKKAHHLIGKASVPLPPSVDDADEEASVKAWHVLMDKKNKKECGSIELKVVVVDVSATEVLALHNCRQNETGGTAKAHLSHVVDASANLSKPAPSNPRQRVHFAEAHAAPAPPSSALAAAELVTRMADSVAPPALEDELPIRLDVSPADAFAAAGAVFFATFVLIHLLALDF